MNACPQKETLLAALCALAIVVAGGLVADGLKSFRMADRTVSVKGLADATKNAKAAAAEFAAQAGAGVGTIKAASQGVFQILPRDPVAYENEQNQRYKLVRVVSTVVFYLD